jgi:UPF0755 protein
MRLAVIIIAAVLGISAAWIGCLVLSPLRSDQIVLKVNPGDNASVIATKLAQNKIIRSRGLFTLLAKLRGTDRKLRAGSYTFGGHYNLLSTIALLEKGNSEAIRVTFPEGFSLHKALRRLERAGLADYDSLMARASDSLFVRSLTGINAPSLEGYFYPDTYHFDIHTSLDSLLAIPVRRFFGVLGSSGIDPKTTAGFYERLVLASIVQQESGSEDEMPIVASVFINRLALNMRLESCSSVDYLLEQRGIKREVLTNADISDPSPYNTYRHAGLPPTPICNPSLIAIKAALNPPQTNYLYFVADRRGGNDFSSSYQEHLRKKAIYGDRRFGETDPAPSDK